MTAMDYVQDYDQKCDQCRRLRVRIKELEADVRWVLINTDMDHGVWTNKDYERLQKIYREAKK